MLAPDALADRLAALEADVDQVACSVREVAVPSYAWGPRPIGGVEVRGGGLVGTGEIVEWTLDGQRALASEIEAVAAGRLAVGAVRGLGLSPYAACALEAALIDLAMVQAGLTFASLAGVAERALRWVVSIDADPDPAERCRALQAQFPGAMYKIDVDPTWTPQAMDELARLGGVAVLDFKDVGDAALVRALRARFGACILEDPPISSGRFARDRPVLSVADARRAVDEGALINVKAPRMGSVLTALEALAVAPAGGAYFGGMFELGPGRVQARLLASLYTPEAPNDLAPIPRHASSAPRRSPVRVALDRPGFGAATVMGMSDGQ